jgi:signal transduction histidine kinase
MVHNVLDASAIETRMIAPHKKQVDLNHLVADVVELYRAAALTKGVSLSKALAAGMPAVYLDEQLVGRAIGNLVSNAIKYTESQGEVEVRTEWENQAVGITVRDTGCGIATEEQLRIFEPYRRSTPSTSVEGTGLGLYIVRRVAEVHGGSVEVASRPGEGSAFTLSFPLD